MRTYSTIISMLVLLACANATKTVSYSDIVYSLMELNDDDQSLENLSNIHVSLAESKEKLIAFDDDLRFKCNLAEKTGSEKLQSYGNQLIALEQSKTENSASQTAVREQQEEASKIITTNQENIDNLNVKISSEKATLANNERSRAERVLIYKRLQNFVQDELASQADQRKTDMTSINVDKSFSGQTSFVQLQHIRSDLTSIAAKASNPMTKSMITTLLLITQSNNKNLFADQGLVTKVQGLLNSLVQKELEAFQEEEAAANNNISSFKSMISNLSEEADRKKQEELMNEAEISSLELAARNIDNEIKSFTRAQDRQRKKNAVQEDLCRKQEDLIKLHLNDFELLESQFSDLKNNLA